jgi:hypothetical protein
MVTSGKELRRLNWEEYRRRMLSEISRFIEWGLRHPDEVISIPAKPAGGGGFPKAVADWFWAVALSARNDGLIERWKEMLLRRPAQLFGRAIGRGR